jgi:hypothetical protein
MTQTADISTGYDIAVTNFHNRSTNAFRHRALTIHGFCDIFHTLTMFQKNRRLEK